MIIRLPLRFEGSWGEKYLYALFDSGATYSCISEPAAAVLAHPEALHRPMRLETANSGHFMEIGHAVRLDFYHEEIRLSDEFLVVPGLSEEVIIGAHTLQKWRLKLDFEHDRVIVDPGVARLVLAGLR